MLTYHNTIKKAVFVARATCRAAVQADRSGRLGSPNFTRKQIVMPLPYGSPTWSATLSWKARSRRKTNAPPRSGQAARKSSPSPRFDALKSPARIRRRRANPRPRKRDRRVINPGAIRKLRM